MRRAMIVMASLLACPARPWGLPASPASMQVLRAWKFAVTVLDASKDEVVLCIVDMALGGPAYHKQDAVAFQPGEGGLLVATGAKFEAPACPHLGE